MSRLPSLSPAALDGEQRVLYDELSTSVQNSFGDSFVTKSPEGAFVGPFGIFMHTPTLGKAFQQTMLSIPKLSELPARPREIAILVVSVHFEAAYELYAHKVVALKFTDLTETEISLIRAGQKVPSFRRGDACAFELAKSLLKCPGPLKAKLYAEAVDCFGADATLALVHSIGFYAYLCVLLNAFDEPAPVQPNP